MNVLYFNLDVGNGGGNMGQEKLNLFTNLGSFSILFSKAVDQDLKSDKIRSEQDTCKWSS